MTSPDQIAEVAVGDWIIVRSREYFGFFDHERGQVETIRPKTVIAKVGYGRRRRTIGIDDLIVVADEEAAKRLCAKLESARAEGMRRQRAAVDSYKSTIARLYAGQLTKEQAE